jgi:energy-coupling factor transporter transmembrane protein EcfT
LAQAAGKVFCLSLIVALFTMTTKLSSILPLLLQSNAVQSRLYPLVYIVNTILAVLPSIQYDLQRAIDSETVRRGQKVNVYSLGSWFTILIVILVRVLNRAERFTDTVLDRGYLPSQGSYALINHSLKWGDILLTVLVVVPGLLIWIATL